MNYSSEKTRFRPKRLFTPENAKILQKLVQGKDSALKADLVRFYSITDAIMRATDVIVDCPDSDSNEKQNNGQSKKHFFEQSYYKKNFLSNDLDLEKDLENIIKNMYGRNNFFIYKNRK